MTTATTMWSGSSWSDEPGRHRYPGDGFFLSMLLPGVVCHFNRRLGWPGHVARPSLSAYKITHHLRIGGWTIPWPA